MGEKETNLQKENHLKGGLKGAKEKGREKDRVIMKNQKFAVVKNRCQNQGVIALMKRDLAQSALQDLLWKKSLCQHGRLVKTNVRATCGESTEAGSGEEGAEGGNPGKG